MDNLTLEELGAILDQYDDDDKYLNVQVELPNGEVVGVQDVKNKYNEITRQVEESVAAEISDPFKELTTEEIAKLIDDNSELLNDEKIETPYGMFNLGDLRGEYFFRTFHINEHKEMDELTVTEIKEILKSNENSDLPLTNGAIITPSGVYTISGLKRRLKELEKANSNPVDLSKDNSTKKVDPDVLKRQNEIRKRLQELAEEEKKLREEYLENEQKLEKTLDNENNDLSSSSKTNDDDLSSKIISQTANQTDKYDQFKINLEQMKFMELLNLYSDNKVKISDYSERTFLTPEEQIELDELVNMEPLIIEEATKKAGLTEGLKDLSEQELIDLRTKTKKSMTSITDPDLLKERKKSIRDIDREINYRRNRNIIEQNLITELNKKGANVTKDNLDKVDLNKLNLTDEELRKFKKEFAKIDLFNIIEKTRHKNKPNDIIPENDNTQKEENSQSIDNDKIEEKTPLLLEDKQLNNKFKVTFKNGDFDIAQYTNLEVNRDQVIHGPVIDPVPLNKKGRPKKITAKVFDGWVDENGNVVDLTQPLNRNVVLSAHYKFDLKKAAAVGLGAAVGTVAYVADLAVPTPVPVVSLIGTAGFSIASNIQGKNLANLRNQNQTKASTITAFDEIPADLQEEIATAKKSGYINTFLKTAAVACTISSAAHSIKNIMDANKVSQIDTAKNPTPTPDQTGMNYNDSRFQNVGKSIPSDPDLSTVADAKTQSVLVSDYTPKGQVFKTAEDALNGTNGLNPFKPAFEGVEKFEAYFNGVRVPIEPGQSIDSIVQAVGATDPSQVAINVMNADGVPLTWQNLANLAVDGVEQAASMHL
ncbi:MAG: hypothetical protein E7158_01485 [Firmicutes bacterium]|nr:hypothetical protein [Bacillota bacterium]